VKWIINIDVGTWTWICYFSFLITSSIIATIEWWLDSFVHDNLVLDVVLLFLVIILTRPWVHSVCLSCVWCNSFMLPKFTSLSFEQE